MSYFISARKPKKDFFDQLKQCWVRAVRDVKGSQACHAVHIYADMLTALEQTNRDTCQFYEFLSAIGRRFEHRAQAVPVVLTDVAQRLNLNLKKLQEKNINAWVHAGLPAPRSLWQRLGGAAIGCMLGLTTGVVVAAVSAYYSDKANNIASINIGKLQKPTSSILKAILVGMVLGVFYGAFKGIVLGERHGIKDGLKIPLLIANEFKLEAELNELVYQASLIAEHVDDANFMPSHISVLSDVVADFPVGMQRGTTPCDEDHCLVEAALQLNISALEQFDVIDKTAVSVSSIRGNILFAVAAADKVDAQFPPFYVGMPVSPRFSMRQYEMFIRALMLKAPGLFRARDSFFKQSALSFAIGFDNAHAALAFLHADVRGELINHHDALTGATPLILAIQRGNQLIIEGIIKQAEHLGKLSHILNARDRNGLTPLHWACVMRLNAVIALLLTKKANKNIRTREIVYRYPKQQQEVGVGNISAGEYYTMTREQLMNDIAIDRPLQLHFNNKQDPFFYDQRDAKQVDPMLVTQLAATTKKLTHQSSDFVLIR